MSVSQIKKQFEDFQAYLGRDVAGLERLRKLKVSFTELRGQLASSNVAAEESAKMMDSAKRDLIAVNAEVREARLEIHRLKQIVDNLTRELSQATKPEESTDDADESVAANVTKKRRQYRSAIKELRKHIRHCELPVDSFKNPKASIEPVIRVWDRSAFSKGWSHQDLWILGCSVAILASFNEIIAIRSCDNPNELEPVDDDTDKQKHQTMQWLIKMIDTESDRDAIGMLARKAAAVENANAAISRSR